MNRRLASRLDKVVRDHQMPGKTGLIGFGIALQYLRAKDLVFVAVFHLPRLVRGQGLHVLVDVAAVGDLGKPDDGVGALASRQRTIE
jgi:hypothetical protein